MRFSPDFLCEIQRKKIFFKRFCRNDCFCCFFFVWKMAFLTFSNAATTAQRIYILFLLSTRRLFQHFLQKTLQFQFNIEHRTFFAHAYAKFLQKNKNLKLAVIVYLFWLQNRQSFSCLRID